MKCRADDCFANRNKRNKSVAAFGSAVRTGLGFEKMTQILILNKDQKNLLKQLPY